MSSSQGTARLTRVALRLAATDTRIAAKQDLVSMGFPEIIAKLLYERYGKLTPIIAAWYKSYNAPGSYSENPLWWQFKMSYSRGVSLSSMTKLYEEGLDPESFRRVAEHEDIQIDLPQDQGSVDEFRQELVPEIKERFFREIFFTYSPLMQAVNNGSLKDLAPYKKLRFMDAEVKYDKRRHFDQTEPLKVYQNGFKWIDAGQKSMMLREQMKNCGSSGVMSMDEDRTILALFGPTNKPHVMVTYSPNEKRISGDECAGSSPVKTEYHDYVIDLANHLGARFDEAKSKSPGLRVKYLLQGKAQSIEPLNTGQEYSFDSYFRFIADGQEYYTNGSSVVSGADVARVEGMLARGEVKVRAPQKKAFTTVLVQANHNQLEDIGVTYTPLNKFGV